MTLHGVVTLRRRLTVCRRCGQSDHVADAVIGLDDFASPRLTKAMARLCVEASFAKAAGLLSDLYGVRVATETVRRRGERVARRAREWQESPAHRSKRFKPSAGVAELAVDSGKVRTLEDGWRDLKLEVWQRRPEGSAIAATEWRKRRLPEAGPRLVRASVGPHEQSSPQWPQVAKSVGATEGAFTFVGDGSDWQWNDQERYLPTAKGVLDIYHASEKLHEVGAALHGEKTPAAQAWGAAATDRLVAEGWSGLERLLDDELAKGESEKGLTARQSTKLHEARTYFWKKREYLDYRGQLSAGRVIGSGAVEGEAKQMGRRLKAAGVRWRLANASAMADMGAIFHSGLWHEFQSTAI